MWNESEWLNNEKQDALFYPVVVDEESAVIYCLDDNFEWKSFMRIYSTVDVTPRALVSVP